jgi:hypothetical protein
MFRCVTTFAVAVLLAGPAAAQLATQVPGQLQRNIPQNSLRGDLKLVSGTHVVLNDEKAPRQLAAGGLLRKPDNLLSTPAEMFTRGDCVTKTCIVNYTLDANGGVHNVWFLTPAEGAVRWPRSQKEAASMVFDPVRKAWVSR